MSWDKIYRSLRVKGKMSAGELSYHLQHGAHQWKEHTSQKFAYVLSETAALRAMNTTEITLIAAPGANKYIMIDEIFGISTKVTTAFTGANDIEFRYTDASGDQVVADFPAAWLNVATGSLVRASQGIATVQTPVANALICMTCGTADPGAGVGGYTELLINYRIVDFA